MDKTNSGTGQQRVWVSLLGGIAALLGGGLLSDLMGQRVVSGGQLKLAVLLLAGGVAVCVLEARRYNRRTGRTASRDQ